MPSDTAITTPTTATAWRGQHQHRRGQDRLEQIQRVDLVAVLELQRREAGGGEEDQEQRDGRPRRRQSAWEAALGEQPDCRAGGGQRHRDQQHGQGEGAASRLPRAAGVLAHRYSQTPYQADPGRVSP
jgi:hypothetical protein